MMQLDGGISYITFNSTFNKCFLQFWSQKSEIHPGQVVQLGRACTKRLQVCEPHCGSLPGLGTWGSNRMMFLFQVDVYFPLFFSLLPLTLKTTN